MEPLTYPFRKHRSAKGFEAINVTVSAFTIKPPTTRLGIKKTYWAI